MHTSLGYSPPYRIPNQGDLHKAAEILNSGKRVAMRVRQGAKEMNNESAESAELLGCGVAKALRGKQVLPDELLWVTGCLGLLGTKHAEMGEHYGYRTASTYR